MTEASTPLRALVLPTERAPTVQELKRALLSFEEVHVLDPSDRELMDPAAFMGAISGGFMPFAVGGGSVLPMPKTPTYDEDFGQTVDHFDKSGAAGALIVEPRPVIYEGSLRLFGPPPVPDGWPNPSWTLQVFRSLAADPAFMTAAARSLSTWTDGIEQVSQLRPANPQGLVTSNVLPDIAPVDWGDRSDLQELLNYLAAARLGNLVRVLGMCEVGGFVPYTADASAEAVLYEMVDRIQRATQTREQKESTVALHVALAQSVVLRESLDEAALEALTVADVIRLRDRGWGQAQKERASFLKQVGVLATDATSAADFEERVESAARSYLQARADLGHEWKKLKARTVLNVIGAASKGAAAALAASALNQELITSGVAFALTVVADLARFGDAVSNQVLDALKKEADAGKSSTAALVSPYRYFVRR